jgi:hypothetical protein
VSENLNWPLQDADRWNPTASDVASNASITQYSYYESGEKVTLRITTTLKKATRYNFVDTNGGKYTIAISGPGDYATERDIVGDNPIIKSVSLKT